MSDLSETKQLVDEVGQVLIKAAEYIEVHGWCQGAIEDDQGRVCIVGALGKAYGYAAQAPMTRLSDYLHNSPVNWNNAKGRTKEEVIAALRAAAV